MVAGAAAAGDGRRGLGGFADGWFTHGRADLAHAATTPGETAAVKSDRLRRAGAADRALAGAGAEPWRRATGSGSSPGCDKRAETCRAKFDNFLNFRGFPHIPGDDWVTAYPKDGANHDGGPAEQG